MSKISAIVEREYLNRVKKKSFVVMTILGPIIFAAIFLIPAWLATRDAKKSTVQVLDESSYFKNMFEEKPSLTYKYLDLTDIEKAKIDFLAGDDDILLYIKSFNIEDNPQVLLFAKSTPGLEIELGIKKTIEGVIKDKRIKNLGLDPAEIKKLSPNAEIATRILDASGEKDASSAVATILGYIGGFMIYIFIFLYGSHVMNGVIEEKTSRIIEVIISSVKPFELMMGKVIGIALVGLTQFLLWGILTYGITTIGSMVLATKSDNNTQMLTAMAATNAGNAQVEVAKEVNSGNKIDKLLKGVGSINIPWLLFAFVFYFLGGYLLYSALFAAIGAAVDNQTDAQQFMLPITGPVIFSIAMASFVIKDPDSTLSFWLSVVPFTSPIIMMIRMPFEPPLWEVLVSMAMLVLGFIGTIWMAGRIYRVGILMYGKKVTYKELSKWLFYKG